MEHHRHDAASSAETAPGSPLGEHPGHDMSEAGYEPDMTALAIRESLKRPGWLSRLVGGSSGH